MRLSTFISYETADKALSRLPLRERRHEKGEGDKEVARGKKGTEGSELAIHDRMQPKGKDIIAGGLMRRHNCTIIDDRFIRRANLSDWNRGHRGSSWSHIIIKEKAEAPCFCSG